MRYVPYNLQVLTYENVSLFPYQKKKKKDIMSQYLYMKKRCKSRSEVRKLSPNVLLCFTYCQNDVQYYWIPGNYNASKIQ